MSDSVSAILNTDDLRRLVIDSVDNALSRPRIYWFLSEDQVRLLKAWRSLAESDDGTVLGKLLQVFKSSSAEAPEPCLGIVTTLKCIDRIEDGPEPTVLVVMLQNDWEKGAPIGVSVNAMSQEARKKLDLFKTGKDYSVTVEEK